MSNCAGSGLTAMEVTSAAAIPNHLCIVSIFTLKCESLSVMLSTYPIASQMLASSRRSHIGRCILALTDAKPIATAA